jgi:hypothetical protein
LSSKRRATLNQSIIHFGIPTIQKIPIKMPRGGRKNAGDQQRQNDAPPGLEAVIAEHFGNDSMASLDSHLQNRNQRSQQEAPAGVPNQQLPMDIPPPGFSQYGAPPPGN